MIWRKVCDEKRYGRFYIDWKLMGLYPDYVQALLAHFLVVRSRARFAPEDHEYEAFSPFFAPVEAWTEPLPLYHVGLNYGGGVLVSDRPLHLHWPVRDGQELPVLAFCEGCHRHEDLRPTAYRDGNWRYRCPYAHARDEVGQVWHNALTGEEFALIAQP